MGACDYQTTASGRTLREAYENARAAARAENGHQEGYSGDIQTSCGVREFEVPARCSAHKLLAYAEAAQQADWYQEQIREADQDARRWPEQAQHFAKQKKAAEQGRAKALKRIPERYAPLARQIAGYLDAKCGPAVALQVTGKAATEYKRIHGGSGTRAKVWIFAGTARC